jgi:hypothetical protein
MADDLGHQLRVQFRLLDLLDVDEDLAAWCASRDRPAKLVDFSALAPDDDPGPRGEASSIFGA